MYGRKPIFLFGLIVFVVASVTCGFATSMLQLVVFRTIQGARRGRAASRSRSRSSATSTRRLAARQGPGPLLGRLGRDGDHRAGGRRDHHDDDRLAVGVLDQPADRDHRRDPLHARLQGEVRTRSAQARPAGARSCSRAASRCCCSRCRKAATVFGYASPAFVGLVVALGPDHPGLPRTRNGARRSR